MEYAASAAGHVFEELRREMRRRSIARAAVIDLRRMRFQKRNQFAYRTRWKRRVHGDYQRTRREFADGRQILERVERKIFINARIDRETARNDKQHLPVRCGLCNSRRADGAVRATAVIDNDRHSP